MRPGDTRGALFSALAAFGFGILSIAVGTGVVPEDTFPLYAPLWVITACGLVSILMGIAVLQLVVDSRWLHRIQPGLAIVVLLAAITNWVAFGPGERHFSGSVRLLFWSKDTTSSELAGRALFGVSAVLLDALAIGMLYWGVRQWIGRRRSRVSG